MKLQATKARKTARKHGGVLSAAVALLMVLDASAGISLDSELSRMTFDDQGRVVSFKGGDGRELVKQPEPFVTVRAGETKSPERLSRDGDGRLVFLFKDGEIVLSVRRFWGGWTFRTERFAVPGATDYGFGRFAPVCTRYQGNLVNAWSDEKSAVCTRGYEEGVSFSTMNQRVSCSASSKEVRFEGLRFGVAAGPRDGIIRALRAMTEDSGIPHSRTGGAWSLGAEENRRSYLMCYGLHESTVDDWLELCLRGGFGTFHVDECWVGYGHYDLRPDCFPGGKAALKAAVDKAHGMGLTCDIHTLTSSVGYGDSWVTPEAADGFVVTAEYTLAEPLPADKSTKTVVVNEQPSPKHDFVQTYIGNGNFLQLGTEMIQYTGVTQEAPWTFTGCKRGALGTTVKAHGKGSRVIYPRHRFHSFLVDADSSLADELAAVQGDLFGVCGFDQIYLDGLDGIQGLRQKDRFARKIYGAAYARGKPPLYEDSSWVPSLWWFHSRIGANDYVFWAPKRSLDRRFKTYVEKARLANFMELDMGWWPMLFANGRSYGYRLDDHEYFGAKCAAHDAAMSVRFGKVHTVRSPLPPALMARDMTVLGWYERFRYARAFTETVLDRFRVPGDEFRLRQDPDGVWRVRPLAFLQHRVLSSEHAAWEVRSHEVRESAVRVEPLANAAPYDSGNALTLLDPAEAKDFRSRTAKGVTVSFVAGDDPEKGPVLKVTAKNSNAARRGAWSQVSRKYLRPAYGDMGSRGAFAFWVKGDGSGALLNLQLRSPREYMTGLSEHYLKLDFKGWRYVEFHLKERDTARFGDYVWPYEQNKPSISYPLESNVVKMLEEVSVYLNEIPAGGGTAVELTAVKALDLLPSMTLKDVAVTVNGRDFALPFALDAGLDYAELDGGFWTRYTNGGVPCERAPAVSPTLSSGANRIAFRATPSGAATPRVQVTFLALGERFVALRDDANARVRPALAYEAVEPAIYAPSKGFRTIPDLVTRPGETATVSFEVYGPISPFRLKIGDEVREFPFALTELQYVTCTDGVHWQLKERGANFGLKRSGEIAPFAAFSGSKSVSLLCSDAASAFARLDLAKHYIVGRPFQGKLKKKGWNK